MYRHMSLTCQLLLQTTEQLTLQNISEKSMVSHTLLVCVIVLVSYYYLNYWLIMC